MNEIAPQDMRQHLMLNESCLCTAEEVAQEIGDCWDATEEFSRDEKDLAGFIAPDGKGPEKQEKGRKQGGKRRDRGLGFKPERGEQRRFGGHCNWCWRIGNKEAQCWFRQENTQGAVHNQTRCKETLVNGQTHRRKGKVITSPKGEER